MENLLKHKLEKMLIFDQKILEVANANKPCFNNNFKTKSTYFYILICKKIIEIKKLIYVL